VLSSYHIRMNSSEAHQDGLFGFLQRQQSSQMTAFWDTAPCSLVEVDRRFRGAYCLHRITALMMVAVRISKTSVYFNETTRHCITYSPPLEPEILRVIVALYLLKVRFFKCLMARLAIFTLFQRLVCLRFRC
jgi:hypothetical protein